MTVVVPLTTEILRVSIMIGIDWPDPRVSGVLSVVLTTPLTVPYKVTVTVSEALFITVKSSNISDSGMSDTEKVKVVDAPLNTQSAVAYVDVAGTAILLFDVTSTGEVSAV